MKHIITFILAAFLAFMGSAFAQQAMPGPGPIPGCPLTGCTFTGAVLTPNPIDVYDNFSGPANKTNCSRFCTCRSLYLASIGPTAGTADGSAAAAHRNWNGRIRTDDKMMTSECRNDTTLTE
jgi:hypothetical protein